MVGVATTITEPFAAARVTSSCLRATRLVAEVAQASSFLIPRDTIAPEHVVLPRELPSPPDAIGFAL
jgi:hypothetical protein